MTLCEPRRVNVPLYVEHRTVVVAGFEQGTAGP